MQRDYKKELEQFSRVWQRVDAARPAPQALPPLAPGKGTAKSAAVRFCPQGRRGG